MEPAGFGEMLRCRRAEARLSMRQLAAMLRVSHVYLGEIERGRRILPRPRWDALVAALPSVTLEELERYAAAKPEPPNWVTIDLSLHSEDVREVLRRLARYGKDAEPSFRQSSLVNAAVAPGQPTTPAGVPVPARQAP